MVWIKQVGIVRAAHSSIQVNPILRELRKMDEIGEVRPMQFLPRLKWDLARHNAKKILKELLQGLDI